ncbi:MAG: ATP-binding protein [Bacteroidetes bacterium]|nr:ATP-binding protein [Bacteroidota bacterium]
MHIPSDQTRQPDFQMVIPSLLEKLADVESMTEKLTSDRGISEDDRDNLAIAITELTNNAIIHGNKFDVKLNVIVSFYFDNSTVCVYIKDEGPGFDPGAIGNPLDPENLMKESGRGIFILKSIMDEVEFIVTKSGTEAKITKKLSA